MSTPGRITYQREQANLVVQDIVPLMHEHWTEIAYSQHEAPYDPDIDAFLRLDAAGALRLFTARDDGDLVGYACYMVFQSLNHRTERHANESGVFIHPGWRRGLTAWRMLKHADGELVREGIKAIHYNVPRAHPTLGVLLERRGYSHSDDGFVRRF